MLRAVIAPGRPDANARQPQRPPPMQVLPRGQQKQPSEQPHCPPLHWPPQGELPQSLPELQAQTPALHWLPSGAFEQSATHEPIEQQPPLHGALVPHEVEHAPLLQAIPCGHCEALVHGPASAGPASAGPASAGASAGASAVVTSTPTTSATTSFPASCGPVVPLELVLELLPDVELPVLELLEEWPELVEEPVLPVGLPPDDPLEELLVDTPEELPPEAS